MIPSNLLKNLMLCLYALKVLFGTFLRKTDNFESIDISCFLSSHQINFSESPFPQNFEDFEV